MAFMACINYNLRLFEPGQIVEHCRDRVGHRESSHQTDRPLRIALLGYRSNPFSGGQGIYIKYLSRALTAAGHEVHVISGPLYPDLDDNIRLIKIPSLDLFTVEHHIRALRFKHLLSWADFF